MSRRGQLLLVGAGILLLVSGGLLYRGYDYIQHDPGFCRSCHIMEEPAQKWSVSPHHLVTCHACHQQTLRQSLEQVWFYVRESPEKVVHHPELNYKVCAQCHLSQDPQWKLVGETAGHKIHFDRAGIDCLFCHLGGLHEFLRPTDACLNCHADKISGPGKKMAFLHCTDCHLFLAKKDQLLPNRETCLSCHSDVAVPHFRMREDQSCADCHSPHRKGAR